MRNPKRINPIINSLIEHKYLTQTDADFIKELWLSNPDYRLGQLLVNTQVVPACSKLLKKIVSYLGKRDPFFPEDHEIMSILCIPTRDYFIWGSRGVNGDQPLTYKPLKELDDNHLKLIAIHLQDRIDNGDRLEETLDIINREIAFRELD